MKNKGIVLERGIDLQGDEWPNIQNEIKRRK